MVETQENFLKFGLRQINVISPVKTFKLGVEEIMQLSTNNTDLISCSI